MRDTVTTVTAHAYLVVVEERIWELWRYRQWCRRQPDSAWWTPLRLEYESELRALVRLARKARALAMPAVESLDEMTTAKASLALGDHYAGMPS